MQLGWPSPDGLEGLSSLFNLQVWQSSLALNYRPLAVVSLVPNQREA